MEKVILTVVTLLLLSGCQSTGLYLANAANDDDIYIVDSNISYGKEDWQKLDIYYPGRIDATAPTIVFYYGGSWRKGSKEDYAFVANRFVREGYIVIIPDYVKYPPAVYPAFVEDAAKVTKWITNHAKDYAFDTSRLYLMGHSAGAHIGMMLLADDRFLAEQTLETSVYKGFIGISGPYDFTPGSSYYGKIFGPKERYPLMQASNYIDGSEPPMLLMTAGLDWLVADSNTDKVVVAMEQVGGRVETKSYPGLGHMTIIGSFSDTLPIGSDVTSDILAFIDDLESLEDVTLMQSPNKIQYR